MVAALTKMDWRSYEKERNRHDRNSLQSGRIVSSGDVIMLSSRLQRADIPTSFFCMILLDLNNSSSVKVSEKQ